ncbi:MAG: diaminopimelate decarboxylase [Paracoccaceae bacterium]
MYNIKIKKINDFFTYRNNILYIEDVSVIDISRNIKTPFYVYSASSLKRRYTDLAKSLKTINHSLYFSVKSNSNLAVLRVLSLLGSGMDVVSGGEYLRAQKAGVPGDKIVFSGVGKTSDEIKLALDNGIRQFNVESIPEIMMINKIASAAGKKAPISIRVNPDVDAQTHKKIMTGKSENKFGIPINSALEVYKMASELKGIKIVGIDLHIGSQITDILPFEIAFIKIADFIKKLRENGHSIDRVDIGGGLGISYSSKEKDPISIDKFSLMLSKIFKDINIEIQLEPGRFISGNSGLLITSVVFFKEGTNKNFLIIDAGMNDLLRPAIYDAEHEFLPVNDYKKNNNQIVADIVGPICESSDIFSKNATLPKMVSGDFLAIYSAGAYGAVMSSEYNSRPLIPELIVSENLVSVVRSRPKIEEVINRDQIPYWLR